MTIQYASDLHLELQENAEFVRNGALETSGEVLLLAGDTCRLDQWDKNLDNLFDWMSTHYRQVIMVPGKDEFTSPDSKKVLGNSWRFMLRENVGVYYNQVVLIDDVELVLVGDETFMKAFPQIEGRKILVVSHQKPKGKWLKSHQVDYWIHGQTHEKMAKRRRHTLMGEKRQTTLLSNPLGYVSFNQHMMGYLINKSITL